MKLQNFMQPQKLTSRKSWGYENKRNNEERSINGSAVVKGILPLRRGNFLRAYTQGYIYIYSIISKQPRQGNGTKALREFIDLFGESSDLWLFCDDELGTDTDTLYSWYAKFGFVPTKERISEYNVTHKRQATRHIGI